MPEDGGVGCGSGCDIEPLEAVLKDGACGIPQSPCTPRLIENSAPYKIINEAKKNKDLFPEDRVQRKKLTRAAALLFCFHIYFFA